VTERSARIGVLGGMFDPIHRGHLELGEAAWSALGLTRLYVVPAHQPPHRTAPVASSFHRFAMVALGIAGHAGWRACDMELLRAEPSYTATTLKAFHARAYRPTDLYFIIGADAFRDIATWRDYPAILDAAHFAVVSRPGCRVRELESRLPDLAPRMTTPPEGRSAATAIFLIDAPTSDVSSTAIRQRLAEGRPLDGLVPPAVRQHIEQHGLYAPSLSAADAARGVSHPAAGPMHGPR
jgi:nicotinate-nucleotide adenylyltransferase